jgi:hypothetical protein
MRALLPVANVAKNTPREMFCIHTSTQRMFFYNIKQQKKKEVIVNVAKNTHL